MTSTDDKLEPCRFCGSDDVFTDVTQGSHYGECGQCGAMGPNALTEAEAITAWNNRATDTQVSKHSELAEESLALELLGRLTDKIEAGVDAIFLPREKAIACVSEFIAEQREGFLIDLATVMHKHLENWPEGEFKKVSTAMALLDKTLHSALNPSKHDYWGAGEPDCPKEIKAGNGELHTLRCRVCGMDNPSDNRCAALRQAPDAQVSSLVGALEGVMPYVLNQFLECHGDKCRHPTCASCFGETHASEQSDKADLAVASARSALDGVGSK